jgi:hypothetical protein
VLFCDNSFSLFAVCCLLFAVSRSPLRLPLRLVGQTLYQTAAESDIEP